MRSIPISALIVSLALIINMLLAFMNGPDWAVWAMFLAGPFLMVWMVLHVLRDPFPYRELEDREEWGYLDRPDLRPARP